MKLNTKIICLIGLVIALGSHAGDIDSEDPAALLEHTATQILAQIGARHEEFTQNEEALQNVVRADLVPLLDTRYTGRLILGKAGREATPEQVEVFATTMTEMLIRRYSSALLKYHADAQFEVLPIRGELNPRMTRVRTRVRLQSGGFAPVDYAFRNSGDGWKIFDVIIEGISYVTTFRSQIVPQVQAEGLDTVIQKLKNDEIVLAD
jgi:phospholipid transport system substrate-binding protein